MIQSSFSRMRKVRVSLGKVIASREGDFLELGSKLHALATRSDSLVDGAKELVESTVGDVLGEVIQQLDQKMTVMRTMCDNTDTSGIDEFSRVRSYLSDLLKLLENYSRIVRTLQMLAISTRIESARLGADGRGFNTLADDVEKLGFKIVEYSSSIHKHAGKLDILSVTAGERMASIGAMQKECSIDLFSRVKENLGHLNGYGQSLSSISQELTNTMSDIQESIGGIVSSMQFHDIVRQQVEHVEEILGESEEYVQSILSDHSEEDVASWLATITTLQAMQISSAHTSFTQAVQTLRDGLISLCDHVHMVDSVADSAKNDDAGNSPLASMNATVVEIASHFEQLAEQGEAVGEVMVAVADTVVEMTAFLEDIEDVGAEIELIALNASIKAAHTGDLGKALGVLALSIQRLSHDAGIQTGDIAEKLQAIAGSADVLRSHAQAYLDTRQADAMTNDLADLMKQLSLVQGKADSLLGIIESEANSLTNDINTLSRGITVDKTVGDALRVAQSELESIASDLGGEKGEGAVELPGALQVILERYTMESERAIHRNLLVDSDDGQDIELFGDDFGGNVELF